MMMRQVRSGHHPVQQQGLSLLELLLVVVILSAASLLALELYGNNDNQLRFEQTRQRLQQIRHAIIGNPQQNRSGFVQDMGRLPVNLRELVQPPISCDGGAVPDDDPNNNGVPDACEWKFDDDSGLWAGWRGPYLDTLPGINGSLSFRDAWGNTNPGAPENFGWRFETNANGDVFVQSRGLDQQANPADAATFAALTDYERDYPPSADALDVQGLPRALIRRSEYELALNNSGLTFDLGFLPGCWSCLGTGTLGFPHSDRTLCNNAGGSWAPEYEYTDLMSCTSAMPVGTHHWSPTDLALVSLYFTSNGKVNKLGQEIGEEIQASITYTGSHEQIVVSVPAAPPDVNLGLGGIAYSITIGTDSDSNGSLAVNEVVAFAPPHIARISPVSPLLPLHWSVF